MKRIVEKTAEASGATATFELDAYYNPVTCNDPKLTARVLPVCESAWPARRTCKEIPLITGAEDFAYFAKKMPSFYLHGGRDAGRARTRSTAPGNHSPLFYLDETGIPLATRAMTAVAVDYLGQ